MVYVLPEDVICIRNISVKSMQAIGPPQSAKILLINQIPNPQEVVKLIS